MQTKRLKLFQCPAWCFCGVFAALILFAVQATAMSPVLFFRQVERVGLLCAVAIGPDAAAAAPESGWLCSLAAAELADLLGPGAPPVVTLAVNDERLADPALLVVLLHAHTRTDAAAGAVTALSAALHRGRPDAGAPPFFIAPPEAVVGSPSAPPPADAVRAAVRRLLTSAAARPLLAARPPAN